MEAFGISPVLPFLIAIALAATLLATAAHAVKKHERDEEASKEPDLPFEEVVTAPERKVGARRLIEKIFDYAH